MFCRKCGKELVPGVYVCQCGENNTPHKGGFPWKVVLLTVAALVFLAGLAQLVYLGTKGDLSEKSNDVYFKESYTVDAETAMANRETVVAVMGNDKLTNGQLQVFYGMQIIDYLSTNGAVFDYTQPLSGQIYDKSTGLTWEQFFLETALNTWKQYRIITNRAKEANYQLEEVYQTKLDTEKSRLEAIATENNFESLDALIQADMGPGCTFDDYYYYMELYYYGNLYFRDLAEEIEVSMEEMEAYFVAHEVELAQSGITKNSGILADVRKIYIKPDGGGKGPDNKTTVYTDAEMTAARAEIQSILDTWLAGDKTAASFAKLAEEKSDDTKTAANGGLYAYLYENGLTEVDVRHILIMPEGGSTDSNGNTSYSDSEWQTCQTKAQAIWDEFLAGEQTEARFGELAKLYTKDGNGSVGGVYMDVPLNYMVKPFEEWIFDKSRQPGDTGLVKTTYGYHVMYFVHRDDALDSWIFDETRQAGDYEILRADDGWHLVYYVGGEEGWIRLCRGGVMDEKTTELLESLLVGHVMEPRYTDIVLGRADLG